MEEGLLCSTGDYDFSEKDLSDASRTDQALTAMYVQTRNRTPFFCGAEYVVAYQRWDNAALPPPQFPLRGQLELSQEISYIYDLRVLVRKKCIYADQFCIGTVGLSCVRNTH